MTSPGSEGCGVFYTSQREGLSETKDIWIREGDGWCSYNWRTWSIFPSRTWTVIKVTQGSCWHPLGLMWYQVHSSRISPYIKRDSSLDTAVCFLLSADPPPTSVSYSDTYDMSDSPVRATLPCCLIKTQNLHCLGSSQKPPVGDVDGLSWDIISE